LGDGVRLTEGEREASRGIATVMGIVFLGVTMEETVVVVIELGGGLVSGVVVQ